MDILTFFLIESEYKPVINVNALINRYNLILFYTLRVSIASGVYFNNKPYFSSV